PIFSGMITLTEIPSEGLAREKALKSLIWRTSMKFVTRVFSAAVGVAVVGVLPALAPAHELVRAPVQFAQYGPQSVSRDVDWRDLPEPVQRTIRREFGDQPLGLLQYARQNDRQFFRVVIHGPYHDALARIGLDGRLLGVEDIRPPAPVIREPVREPIREPVREAPIERDAPRRDYDTGRRD